MDIIFSDEFKRKLKKINDEKTQLKIIKTIKKIEENPKVGKPLKYNLKNKLSVRLHPFRIIYDINKNKILIITIHHRKDVYK